jgi:hypothetical protein
MSLSANRRFTRQNPCDVCGEGGVVIAPSPCCEGKTSSRERPKTPSAMSAPEETQR